MLLGGYPVECTSGRDEMECNICGDSTRALFVPRCCYIRPACLSCISARIGFDNPLAAPNGVIFKRQCYSCGFELLLTNKSSFQVIVAPIVAQPEETCAICLERLAPSRAPVLPHRCSHAFCATCVAAYQSTVDHGFLRCPLCRVT